MCFGINSIESANTTIVHSDLALNLYRDYPWCTNITLKYYNTFGRYGLRKHFIAKYIKDKAHPYDIEKYNAAISMNTKEFIQWLADKEHIDISKPPVNQLSKHKNQIPSLDSLF